MVNPKAIVLLIALSVIVALIAGIAFSRLASATANANRNVISQTPQGTINGAYPYGLGQCGNPYGDGGGMGMCGRFW